MGNSILRGIFAVILVLSTFSTVAIKETFANDSTTSAPEGSPAITNEVTNSVESEEPKSVNLGLAKPGDNLVILIAALTCVSLAAFLLTLRRIKKKRQDIEKYKK